ncbi:hypothetical protein LguiA_008866 [Lonicera macranthoides]
MTKYPAAEVGKAYESSANAMTLVQQRSPVVKVIYRAVVCRYITYPVPMWMGKTTIVKDMVGKNCRNMILLRGAGNISVPWLKVGSALAEGNAVQEDSLPFEDELGEEDYYPSLPFAALFSFFKGKGLKVTCLLCYCSEGDNKPDSFHLAEAASKLLHLSPNNFQGNEGGKWTVPFSWQSDEISSDGMGCQGTIPIGYCMFRMKYPVVVWDVKFQLRKKMMGKKSYLAMKTDSSSSAASELITSDQRNWSGCEKVSHPRHARRPWIWHHFSSMVCFFCCNLLAGAGSDQLEDQNSYSTINPLHLLEGDFGKWVAFIAVILRLFFPKRFPDWLEMPGALVLLIVVSPSLLADVVRGSMIGVGICLVIGCYLLREHIRASGGFRNSFTKTHGISNSVGIILLLVHPVWAVLLWAL